MNQLLRPQGVQGDARVVDRDMHHVGQLPAGGVALLKPTQDQDLGRRHIFSFRNSSSM